MKHIETYPTSAITTLVDNLRLNDIDRLPCPYCNDQMWQVDNGDFPHEEYTGGGWFLRTERYVCANCDSYADVVQKYQPNDRVVRVYVPDTKEESWEN